MSINYMNTKIRQIVRSTLKERFPSIKISQIQLEQSAEDDPQTITIKIVFEAGKDFSPADLREVPRLLRKNFEEAKENAFPVVSFISKSDWGKSNSAAVGSN